jgi:hypothetical protein
MMMTDVMSDDDEHLDVSCSTHLNLGHCTEDSKYWWNVLYMYNICSVLHTIP